MKNFYPRKNTGCTGGFSLVEVAMAVGIAGVALFSVVGLLATLMDSDRANGINTVLSNLTTQTIDELKAQTYPPTTLEFYFDINGRLVAKDAGPLYKCTATLSAITPPVVTDANNIAADPGDNTKMVKLEFVWPAQITSANNLNRRIVYATIAKTK